MRMIDRVIRSMQDTGLIDGMSLEDADTLATASLEAMREPSDAMISEGEDVPIGAFYLVRNNAKNVFAAMIDAALNE